LATLLFSKDLCGTENTDDLKVWFTGHANSLNPVANPDVSTDNSDIELCDDIEGVDQIDQRQETLKNVIDLLLSTKVSIDLPPLECTFLTEPEIALDEIGVDTNQQYIGSIPYDNRDLNELLFQIQFPQPINGWFVMPNSFHNNFIQLCICSVNTAGSPVIEYTVEIHCNLEWILYIP